MGAYLGETVVKLSKVLSRGDDYYMIEVNVNSPIEDFKINLTQYF